MSISMGSPVYPRVAQVVCFWFMKPAKINLLINQLPPKYICRTIEIKMVIKNYQLISVTITMKDLHGSLCMQMFLFMLIYIISWHNSHSQKLSTDLPQQQVKKLSSSKISPR